MLLLHWGLHWLPAMAGIKVIESFACYLKVGYTASRQEGESVMSVAWFILLKEIKKEKSGKIYLVWEQWKQQMEIQPGSMTYVMDLPSEHNILTERGKMKYSRKFSALMEWNFLISATSLSLGSANQITSPKIRLMKWYSYMAHGNILDAVCDGCEMR